MKKQLLLFFLLTIFTSIVLITACKKCDSSDPNSDCYEATDTITPNNTLVVNWDSLDYAPTPYELVFPTIFENIKDDYYIPPDNPLTEQGIQLGRMLFYDPILSKDSTIACGSCHAIENAFTDDVALSEGVDGAIGRRNSMPLFNLGWQPSFFWDGSVNSLEEQALKPVPNEVEMHQPWEGAVAKLMNHYDYRVKFYEAFGDTLISKELVTKAIAQFERTLISGNSKFDLAVTPGTGVDLSPQEELGYNLFNDLAGGDCLHCHIDPGLLFTDNKFHNTGLDATSTFEEFADWGLGEVTGIPQDNGRFRTPSLRNIGVTAPYMHDGRFNTLKEVLDFYADEIQPSPNLDLIMVSDFNSTGNLLEEEEKEAIIAFLHTLTDTTFLNNPAYKNPFE